MRAIISRGLYIFYPIFKDHFFVFEEVFSENSVLIYGLYSRAAYDGARTVSDLYLDHYQDQLLSIGQFLTIVLLHHLLTKYKIYMIRSLPMNQKNNSYWITSAFYEGKSKSLLNKSQKLDHWYQLISELY